MKKEYIKPVPDCGFCHGEGKVHDWVDYGSSKVMMPDFCECVAMQAEEEGEGELSEIVLVLDFPDDPEELPPDPPNEGDCNEQKE